MIDPERLLASAARIYGGTRTRMNSAAEGSCTATSFRVMKIAPFPTTAIDADGTKAILDLHIPSE